MPKSAMWAGTNNRAKKQPSGLMVVSNLEKQSVKWLHFLFHEAKKVTRVVLLHSAVIFFFVNAQKEQWLKHALHKIHHILKGTPGETWICDILIFESYFNGDA